MSFTHIVISITLSLIILSCNSVETTHDTPFNIADYVLPSMKFIPAKDSTFSMSDVGMVKFTYNFYIDSTEITQEEYSNIMEVSYPNYTKPNWDISIGKGNNYPAYRVNWFDAILYCNARSKAAKKDTVYQYDSIIQQPGDSCEVVGL